MTRIASQLAIMLALTGCAGTPQENQILAGSMIAELITMSSGTSQTGAIGGETPGTR